MVTMERDLRASIDEIMPGVVADRRHFHENPELGYEEFETAKLVAERLQSLGLEDIKTGIATTGVTGLIRGTGTSSGADNVVMVRADMDALPILEENDVDYRSKTDGVMHACGHDSHTAMLLGVTRMLMDRRDEFSGTVKVLFQPAEEGGGGARVMIEEGALEDPHVDYALGMHIAQDVPVGQIELRGGPTLAAADHFEIEIQGKGGHGAQPHLCIDPIAVGAQIVTTLQTIISREVDPTKEAVVTVGAFNSGKAANVIPDTAILKGTLRSFDPEVRDQIASRVGEIAQGVAKSMRAEAEFTYIRGYPATVNNVEITDLVHSIASDVVGEENAFEGPLHMGAEDFSYFLEQVPGCFYFVGSRNEDKGFVWGHHHPRFDIDEDAMGTGMEVMVRSVLAVLDRD